MKWVSILPIFAVFFLSTSNLDSQTISTSERNALIDLYNSTNGDNWTNNSGWKGNNNEADGFSEAGSEGTWYGITVSGGNVTKINIAGNGLNGSLSASLGFLSKLKVLDLFNNALTGDIPPDLGYLFELESIDLSWNELIGEIPSELKHQDALTEL